MTYVAAETQSANAEAFFTSSKREAYIPGRC